MKLKMNRELKELSSLITRCSVSESISTRTAALKILQLMTKDVDLSPIAGNITKLLASSDIFVKKVVCTFIDRYSDRVNGLNLLVTNTLIKDLKDANPLFRGVALKTLFRVPNLTEQEEILLLLALKDSSSYVRRVAVMSCCQYIKNSSDNFSSELIDNLYEMIRDPDPGVVVNCLTSLDEILSSEGGVVINYNIVHYLLSRILSFHEWGISTVLHFIQKYVPQKEEELFEILNSLDDYLTHNNSLIVIQTLQIFLSLCNNNFPHLLKEALNCVFPKIQSNLVSSNNELVYSTLILVEQYIVYSKELFCSNYKLFFCHFSDSMIVKVKKLCILPLLTTSINIPDVSEELITYCTNNSPGIYKAAIKSIVQIANLFPTNSQNLKTLIALIDLQCESLTVEILNAFSLLNLHQDEEIKSLLLAAISKYYKQINETSGKCAILQLLGYYGQTTTHTPYILESMMETVEEEEDAIVKMTLLTTTIRMFLHRPAEMQEILGFLLEKCSNDKHPCISDQAQFYYHLLHDIPLAKKIILGEMGMTKTQL
ncbi:AP-4 complex subunit beta-1-like [Centruroides vittatus]|uniref:AP-4 complex subunit beta-1-like n=1 Tax=Centruroides vittatus TaxID=120091 RepID=UPI0035106884